MTSVLLDTNVVVDVLLGREPFVTHSAEVLQLAARGEIRGLISATGLTTAWYLTERYQNSHDAEVAIRMLVSLLEVASVSENQITAALDTMESGAFADFEDAVQHAAAVSAGAELIITRNGKDFAGGSLSTMTPQAFLESR
ncbi:PIN domain nuclease [soil metagenome]